MRTGKSEKAISTEGISDRSVRCLIRLAISLTPVFAAMVAYAQPPEKRFEAVFTTTPPVIDGILDEAVWQSAAVIEDFHEVEPIEYAPPKERLRFRVLYDEDHLYVAAEINMRNVDEITAFKLAQGSDIREEDRLKVVLDPYNNKRTGYDFRINANGVREEGLFGTIGRPNTDWNGIWDGRAQITEEGWTAELAIPFKTLNFDPDNDVWGISFSLNISGRNEQIAWTSQAHVTRPGSLGEMTGVDRAKQGRGLDIVPSVSFRHTKVFETNGQTGADELRAEPSLDILYKLTPLLTAALTINTDFSAAEVDDRVINLERFPVFFPEKRTFFLQDADIFSFADIEDNGIPFFSRRIGLDDDRQPVDIIGGVKLTGRIGPMSLGVLDVVQEDGPENVNLFAGRAYLNVLNLSTLGMIFTHGSADESVSNSVVGVDFNYVNRDLFGRKGLSSSLWYLESDTKGETFDQDAYGASLGAPDTGGFFGSLRHMKIGENYNPALGFVNRPAIRESAMEFGYSHFPGSGPFQQIGASVEALHIEDLDGNTESQQFELEALELASNTDDRAAISLHREREVLTAPFEIFEGVEIQAGDYSWSKAEIEVTTGDQRPIVAEFELGKGEFYDGDRFQVVADILWQPSKHFSLRAGIDYNDIDLSGGDFISRLMTLRTDIAFNSSWSWNTLAQYDNETDELSVNSRLRWIPKGGQEMIFVVNHGILVDEPPPGSRRVWKSLESDIVLKATYTFRY
jgi:hypothetical protein